MLNKHLFVAQCFEYCTFVIKFAVIYQTIIMSRSLSVIEYHLVANINSNSFKKRVFSVVLVIDTCIL